MSGTGSRRFTRLGDLAERAARLAEEPGLRDAVRRMAEDPRQARIGLTAPHELAAEFGVEVPADLRLDFTRPPIGPREPIGKYVRDFEFFIIRQLDCRTYWRETRDEDGTVTGIEEVNVCFGVEITPKYLPHGPY